MEHRYTPEDIQIALKQKEAVEDLRAILVTVSGRRFFKYLLEIYRITELPERGEEGNMLFETLGFLRSGRAIFNLVNQADSKTASEILAAIEKEAYEKELLERTLSASGRGE